MASYRIKLFDEHGALKAQDFMIFERDDDAVDHADRIHYPHELHVLQGDRMVARLDPTAHEIR